jgi:probable HAF family extracellular repeat protein
VTSQSCVAPQALLYKAVVWSLDASGKPLIQQTLRPLAGDSVSYATALNDAGIVVGASGACVTLGAAIPPNPARAVLWKNGVPHLLGQMGTLGGSEAFPYAINDPGQVVGPSFLAGDAVVHSFLWEGGPMKDLGSLLPDDNVVIAQSLNNQGEVVGESCRPNGVCHAFYWRGGAMIDLNDHLAQPSGLQIMDATDINDSGEIALEAFDPNLNGGTFVRSTERRLRDGWGCEGVMQSILSVLPLEARVWLR